ncbi:unnamed protein product [Ostreobium quekettii]|uniref:Uncharacterized protein n=1 Tax=Ostreobium quekettii TaxID=121088 RepID=A0A8S1J8S1_9CHLO|nr:unnamed protein product [Ostreobium quekettii]
MVRYVLASFPSPQLCGSVMLSNLNVWDFSTDRSGCLFQQVVVNELGFCNRRASSASSGDCLKSLEQTMVCSSCAGYWRLCIHSEGRYSTVAKLHINVYTSVGSVSGMFKIACERPAN